MVQWFFKNAQRKPTRIAVAATITTALHLEGKKIRRENELFQVKE